MNRAITTTLLLALCGALAACGSDPGLLKGRWQMKGPVPATITFRQGETEMMGVIEKVSYKVQGSDVLVTYKNGISEGMTLRYTLVTPDLVRSELGDLHRIR